MTMHMHMHDKAYSRADASYSYDWIEAGFLDRVATTADDISYGEISKAISSSEIRSVPLLKNPESVTESDLAREARLALFHKFKKLAKEWKASTKFVSSFNDQILNESYQKIIGIGPDAVPLILAELVKDHRNWFWALHVLTNENPVKSSNRGNFAEMAKDWIRWAKDSGVTIGN